MFEIIHPEDQAFARSHLADFQKLGTGEIIEFEQRVRHASGTWRWLWHRECVFKRHQDGTPSQMMGTAQDITDRKETEMRLRLSEERFRLLVEGVKDYAIFALDEGGYVIGWNEGASKMKGYQASEIIGRHFSTFYPQEDIDCGAPVRGLETAKSTGKFAGEGWRVRRDGSRFWANVSITPILNETGQLIGYSKIIHDVTDRKNATEALRLSESRLAEAQSIANVGSWDFDVVTGEIVWSEQLFRLLEFDPAKGTPGYNEFVKRYHPDDIPIHNRIIQKAIKDGDPYEFDIRGIMKDRSIRWFHAIGKSICDPAGRPVRLTGTLRDITDAKMLARQVAAVNECLEEANKTLVEQQTALIAGQMQLESLATTDGLTGLKNHRAFQEKLAEEFERRRRYQTALSILLLDVDQFKTFNDAYGHPAGDQVLMRVAAILQESARATDCVARYGGEEFVIVLPETDEDGAIILAERIRQSLENETWALRAITASIGVSVLQPATASPAVLIKEADEALYASKAAGRNCVTVYGRVSREAAEPYERLNLPSSPLLSPG